MFATRPVTLRAIDGAAYWPNDGSVPEFFAGVGLILLFTFAMSWVGVTLGLNVRTVESANQVGFTVIFPLTFLSNVFVPPQTLPGWLQTLEEWNPDRALPASVRDLWGNPNPYSTGGFPARLAE